MGETVSPTKGSCHVMRSSHVVENSIGGSLPPCEWQRGRSPTILKNPNSLGPFMQKTGVRGIGASDSSMPTTIRRSHIETHSSGTFASFDRVPSRDSSSPPPRHVAAVPGCTADPVSAASFACEFKSTTLSSLGELGRTGWWTAVRGCEEDDDA